jgi:hypothetical protein
VKKGHGNGTLLCAFQMPYSHKKIGEGGFVCCCTDWNRDDIGRVIPVFLLYRKAARKRRTAEYEGEEQGGSMTGCKSAKNPAHSPGSLMEERRRAFRRYERRLSLVVYWQYGGCDALV